MIMRLSNQDCVRFKQPAEITAALDCKRMTWIRKTSWKCQAGAEHIVAERITLEPVTVLNFVRLRTLSGAIKHRMSAIDFLCIRSAVRFPPVSASLGVKAIRELDKLAGVLLDVVETIFRDFEVDFAHDGLPIGSHQCRISFQLGFHRSRGRGSALPADQRCRKPEWSRRVLGEFFRWTDGTTPEALRKNGD